MATSIVTVPVPASGDGIAVDVSFLVGEKTVTLSGTFKGRYVLLGSHGVSSPYSPLVMFDADGVEGIKRTFRGAVNLVRLRAQVTEANGVTASVAGLSIPGDNSFQSFVVLAPGSSGPQPSLDLGLVDFQGDLNFIAQGGLHGSVAVEGSLDNVRFNPIGDFSAEPSSSSLLGVAPLVFSPLFTYDRVRYVRLNVHGVVLSSFEVTIGGSQTSSGGGSGATLHDTYEVGSTSVDQTMNLLDTLGGKIVIDGSDPLFTDPTMFQLNCVGGIGAAFLTAGGMESGPFNICIGAIGFPAIAPAWANGYIAIGYDCQILETYTYGGSVAIGRNVRVYTDPCVAIGDGASVGISRTGYNSTAIGPGASAEGYDHVALGVGSHAWGATGCTVIGSGSEAVSNYGVAIGKVSSVTGEDGMAFGRLASAGTGDIAIGAESSIVGDYSIVIGSGQSPLIGPPSVAGFYSIAIGVGTFLSGMGVVGDHSIAIGSQCNCNDSYSLALGYASTTWGLNDIAIGQSASAGAADTSPNGEYSIAIGYQCNATYNRNIAVGMNAHVGDVATEDGKLFADDVVVGTDASAYAVSSVVIGVSAHVGLPSEVAMRDSGIAIGNEAGVDGDNGIAIGRHAVVTGNNGMAFGRSASAGASEIVFSSATAGGANKFAVVSDLLGSGYPDLFDFKTGILGSNNTTTFSLLIRANNGSYSVKPVTLSVPDIHGISVLQVANP